MFIRTGRRADGQTDMARTTRLLIMIENIYTLYSRKDFFLPVTYFYKTTFHEAQIITSYQWLDIIEWCIRGAVKTVQNTNSWIGFERRANDSALLAFIYLRAKMLYISQNLKENKCWKCFAGLSCNNVHIEMVCKTDYNSKFKFRAH